MTVYEKLDNIIYPFSLPGGYTFSNKNDAFSNILQNHGYLNKNGWFISRHPACDPNCQQLAAAINYYLFNICNKEDESVKRLKIKYAVYQNKMFIQDNDYSTLKGLCKIAIRQHVALKLDLVRKKNIFKPLLVINKRYICWDPQLKYVLKKITTDLPKTLEEYIQLPSLDYHHKYLKN